MTTVGFRPYREAIERTFGDTVDYAMLIKEYGLDPNGERRFSPPVVLSHEVRVIGGNPDEDKISTSYVERQNLTMRMSMRRFARPHKSLANPYPRTPAMAAGLADHIWTCEEIAALLD
jgi:hypothetical protein